MCQFPDKKYRCEWVPVHDALYLAYHDQEWGVPVYDDRKLFEFLILEGFQAGLSWRTILHKRENFRLAFDNFDAEKMARYGAEKIDTLLKNSGIVRNRLKIAAAIENAKAFLNLRETFGSFAEFMWRFVDGRPIVNHWNTWQEVPARTALSDRISKELKKWGFRFVGSTIIYAHIQATGMVNDHVVRCFRHQEIIEEFVSPS